MESSLKTHWFAYSSVTGLVVLAGILTYAAIKNSTPSGNGSGVTAQRFSEARPQTNNPQLPTVINLQNCEKKSQQKYSPASLEINTYMDECYYTAHPNTVGEVIGKPGYPLAGTLAAYRASDCYPPRYF